MSTKFHQDLKPIVFKKTEKKPTDIVNKYQSGKNIQNKSDVDLRKIDNEQIKLATATLEMRKCIQEARKKNNITQEELARRCNLPKDVIRDYENGKAIVKQNELSKINKVLGINLKKPKARKIQSDD